MAVLGGVYLFLAGLSAVTVSLAPALAVEVFGSAEVDAGTLRLVGSLDVVWGLAVAVLAVMVWRARRRARLLLLTLGGLYILRQIAAAVLGASPVSAVSAAIYVAVSCALLTERRARVWPRA